LLSREQTILKPRMLIFGRRDATLRAFLLSTQSKRVTPSIVERARKTKPVLTRPETGGMGAREWVKPVLLCEVAFTEWTQDGRIRHPSFPVRVQCHEEFHPSLTPIRWKNGIAAQKY
jgi:ATP-dependent DNA ligase